ncbi:hypothetical protein [Methanoregula sp.]|uniref:hypothetical protein n=1 Tax=Methanoregula sp. TaxID=2052170 RepID=UPI0035625357
MNFNTALIVCVIIGTIFGVILIAAGIGSIESAAGHFVKETLHGTAIEPTAASVETAGNDLMAKAHGAFALFTGLLLVLGLAYVGSKS